MAPLGVMATANGRISTGIVATTALVAVAITETEAEFVFVTYTRAPFGVMATPRGFFPTGIVVTRALVVVFITETEAEPGSSHKRTVAPTLFSPRREPGETREH